MKSLFIALTALFTAYSPLSFNGSEHDFGTIREEAGPVVHTFEFTNTGQNPIAIDRVNTSCGCTTPDFPRQPIAPGAKGRVVIEFAPMGYPGAIEKTVTVVSGGGMYVNKLAITGYVTPRPRSVEEEFPYDIGGGVRMDKTFAALGTLPQGHAAAATINMINTSDRMVDISLQPFEASGVLEIRAPEQLAAGQRGVITLTYDLTAHSIYGPAKDILRVAVGGVMARQTIYASIVGIDNFRGTDIGNAPRLFLDTQIHDFGRVRRRSEPYIYKTVAANEGASALHIRSVGRATGTLGGPEAGFECSLRPGMTIEPGAEIAVEFIFRSDRYLPGAVSESISVVVDDPLRPVRELRIKANIR